MTATPPPAPTWFGQPRGLTVLFLTNMWEQFSYYGMRALLVYYMTKELLFAQGKASVVYGAYTACAYFTPIVGGLVADRYLGKRRAIVIGGSVMAAGHFMMAFPALFYPALAVIALGNGLFLPSLPSQIDDLYAPGDQRVGWAYNVYYVGVNIGGFLAPLACGALGELYGWHWGFGLAGIGMVAGLGIYLWGQRHLPAPAAPRAAAAAPRGRFDRATMVLLLAIAASVTVFRGAYEQIGNTVALWADTGVDKRVGGAAIPMSWFIALNPLFVMLMTPPLLRHWRARAERGRPEAPARRMATGALIVAGAYLLLAALAATNGGGRTGWPWFVLFFAVLTLGELFILPTGLGLFARLAPAGLGATTVAAWFLATFSGSLAGGFVGTLWEAMSHAAFFALLALIAAAAAAMLRLTDTLEQQVQRDRERQAGAA
jgi:proton-dependent oligopeptide transporter, POT family